MTVITVRPAGRPIPLARSLPASLQLAPTSTVADVKRAVRAKYPRLGVERQKLSLEGDAKRKALEDDKTLAVLGLGNGGVLLLRDLGMQISWTLVFVTEYLGPLLIHPIFYYGKDTIYPLIYPLYYYGRDPTFQFKPTFEHSALQTTTFVLCMLHFLKRELETLFLHRFSHSTMPALYIIRNSAHYWFLSGLFVALTLYSPSFGQRALVQADDIATRPWWLALWTAVWAYAEISNFITHLTVRNLRKPGSKERGIPRGYGFDLVSMPNYSFEILAWLAVLAMTRSLAVLLFITVGGLQMAAWADQKHRKYKQEFGDKYPRGRKRMIPFIY